MFTKIHHWVTGDFTSGCWSDIVFPATLFPTNVWLLSAPELLVGGNVTVGQQSIDDADLLRTTFWCRRDFFIHSAGS